MSTLTQAAADYAAATRRFEAARLAEDTAVQHLDAAQEERIAARHAQAHAADTLREAALGTPNDPQG